MDDQDSARKTPEGAGLAMPLKNRRFSNHEVRLSKVGSRNGSLYFSIVNATLRITVATALLIMGTKETMAIEEAQYGVVRKDNAFEIRDYAAHVVAETVVEANLEDAGNAAFDVLFRYISGGNQTRAKVAMTAPVSQQPAGEKISMTAPVGQQRVQEGWLVSFMMPGSNTLETLPIPENPKVILRQVPARRMAAVRYSGFWSEKRYLQHKLELESWIQKMGLGIAGEPVWARYNPPFTPWFLRRNEILIPVEGDLGLENDRQSP